MITLECNQPTYFDVDETLVKWNYANLPDTQTVEVVCNGHVQYLVPCKRNIAQLIKHASRGHTIIVWSQGGHLWAEAVVKALGLEQYVALCIEKPQWYYDDLTAYDFMGDPQFLKDED